MSSEIIDANKVRNYIRVLNVSIYLIAEHINKSVHDIEVWMQGKKELSYLELYQIADLLSMV